MNVYILLSVVLILTLYFITLNNKQQTLKTEECPEISDSFYKFMPEVQIGKNLNSIKEMFRPISTNTTNLSSNKKYIIGKLNQVEADKAMSVANLRIKNGGSLCSTKLPNYLFFELKDPKAEVVEFCKLNYQTYYGTNPIFINVGDDTNPNMIRLGPNNVNSCIYDITYNYNGNIPYK